VVKFIPFGLMGVIIPRFFLMELIPCFDFPFTAVFFALSFHFLVRGFIQKRRETGSTTLWQPGKSKVPIPAD
jgi:hypothetical protein